jgi:glycosyltransferase involved in cell wall biosynthesis
VVKRIGLLTIIASSDFGGAERNVVSLLGALDPSRYEIAIACNGNGPMLDEYRRVAGQVRSFDLVHVWRPTTVTALAAWMRSLDCTVVHTHLWTADLLGGLAAVLARVPVRVASVRGHYFLPVGVSGGLPWRRRWMSGGYRIVYRLFHRVIAVAPSIATDLATRRGARVGTPKIEVIVNGIDIDDIRRLAGESAPPLPAGRPLIVSVGNLSPIKGHPVLLHAMRRVGETYPDAHLLLVGDGPGRVAIERLVAALGLASRVTLVGTRADPSAFCAAADLVVLASLSEGTPRAILEALALAKPVVATAVGGIPNLIVDGVTGRLVAPADPSALANAILEQLSDPSRAQDMGREGRRHIAEHFSVRETARRTQTLYERLLTSALDYRNSR